MENSLRYSRLKTRLNLKKRNSKDHPLSIYIYICGLTWLSRTVWSSSRGRLQPFWWCFWSTLNNITYYCHQYLKILSLWQKHYGSLPDIDHITTVTPATTVGTVPVSVTDSSRLNIDAFIESIFKHWKWKQNQNLQHNPELCYLYFRAWEEIFIFGW